MTLTRTIQLHVTYGLMECHAAPGISNSFCLTHNGRTYTIMTYKSRLFGLTCIKYA